jgi:hypothetical protein
VLAQAEVCDPLEEGILNEKASGPTRGASLETITRETAVTTLNGDRYHPITGIASPRFR